MTCARNFYRIIGLIVLMLALTVCRKQIIVDEISRSQRRMLGKAIADAIEANPSVFPLITRDCNEKAYMYIDSLYSLATNGMKFKRYSGNDNWNKDRVWKFNIINTEEIMAFCIPGGDFYITTGFLQKIDSDHELFFVMTLEAVIMNEGYLTKELRKEVRNDTWLVDIATDGISPTGITADDLAVAIYSEFKYDPIIVKEIDEFVVNSICMQSFFLRNGMYSMQYPLSGFWFNSRPDYLNRQMYIESDTMVVDSIFSKCGMATYTPFQDEDALINFVTLMDWK